MPIMSFSFSQSRAFLLAVMLMLILASRLAFAAEATCLASLGSTQNGAIKAWLAEPHPPELIAELTKRWMILTERSKRANGFVVQINPTVAQKQAFTEIERMRTHTSATIFVQTNAWQGGTDGSEVALFDWQNAEAVIRRWVQTGTPFSQGRLQLLNRLVHENGPLTRNLRGAFRGTNLRLVGGFTPLSHNEIIPALQEFYGWFAEAEKKLHPIALASEVYQRLIVIHPFADGNGRTSRLVMDWILMRNGFPSAAFQDIEDVYIDLKFSTRWKFLVKLTDAVERSFDLLEGK